MCKIVLTSKGLHTYEGRLLIEPEFAEDKEIQNKKILLICIPEFERYNRLIAESCMEAGFCESNIIMLENADWKTDFDYIYVNEGNTFEMLAFMQKYDALNKIKAMNLNSLTYIGTSAGAMIAGKDIRLAIDFDRNFTNITDFEGLQLIDAAIIPHYTRDELQRYKSNVDKETLSLYPEIINVRNDEKVVYNVKERRLKRIRL